MRLRYKSIIRPPALSCPASAADTQAVQPLLYRTRRLRPYVAPCILTGLELGPPLALDDAFGSNPPGAQLDPSSRTRVFSAMSLLSCKHPEGNLCHKAALCKERTFQILLSGRLLACFRERASAAIAEERLRQRPRGVPLVGPGMIPHASASTARSTIRLHWPQGCVRPRSSSARTSRW